MRLLAFNNLIYLKSPPPLHVCLCAVPTHKSVYNPFTWVCVEALQGDLHATLKSLFLSPPLKEVYIQPENINKLTLNDSAIKASFDSLAGRVAAFYIFLLIFESTTSEFCNVLYTTFPEILNVIKHKLSQHTISTSKKNLRSACNGTIRSKFYHRYNVLCMKKSLKFPSLPMIYQ